MHFSTEVAYNQSEQVVYVQCKVDGLSKIECQRKPINCRFVSGLLSIQVELSPFKIAELVFGHWNWVAGTLTPNGHSSPRTLIDTILYVHE